MESVFRSSAYADDSKDPATIIPDFGDYKHPDFMQEVRASEFTGDLSQVEYEKKVKYDFKLKSRDENMKDLMD